MKAFSINGGAYVPAIPPDGPDEHPPSPGGILVYDIEIKNAIKSKSAPAVDGITYCEGWKDYAGMGIAIITAYDFAEARYRIFLEDNLWEFSRLCDMRDHVVGFNSRAFDDNILATRNIVLPSEKAVDLLCAIVQAAGKEPKFPHTNGYGLDPVYRTNVPGGRAKTGDGAMAPILWQQGKIGAVIDYGLNDTQMTVEILIAACLQGHLTCPKTNEVLRVRDFLPEALVSAIDSD